MDYEKKYNEALERARKYMDDGYTVLMPDLFPELRESEDERIRKFLVKHISEWIGCIEHDLKISTKDVESEEELAMFKAGLAYLEKLKEQKPNIELIQRSWYMEGYHDREFNREPKWIIKTGECGPRYEENPKYGSHIEQKPAEWSEEKEKADDNYVDEVIKWEDTHKDWDRQVIRATAYHFFTFQPKQEWSEDDKLMIKCCLEAINVYKHNAKRGQFLPAQFNIGGYLASPKKVESWLKSLRPSWKPSEDEERLINTSISFLKDFADKGYENAVECIDWLKSKLNGNTCK